MRWVLLASCLAFPLVAGLAQNQAGQTTTPPALVAENARVLYVARTLRLRQDQVAKIIPLLNQAQTRLQQRNAALDDLWVQNQPAFGTVTQALVAGKQPPGNAAGAVARATSAHDNARSASDADLERMAEQILAVLDKQQLANVETLRQVRAQEQNQQRTASTASIVAEIQRYAVAMRQLLPDEYDTLRVPMALRLAALLVAPDQRNFNNAVSGVLRILDSVRRLTDAQFAEAQPQLPRNIARALGLPEEAATEGRPVSFNDLMLFVTCERTVALLGSYKADPPMEVVP